MSSHTTLVNRRHNAIFQNEFVNMEKNDRLRELKHEIKCLHLGYLDSECHENNRERLKNNVREFLCFAPNDQKFQLDVTQELLRRNVIERSDFSGAKAARSWAALAKYADNLLVSPWRIEYREVKLYCGFYKHQVESGLLDADIMLEAIGYQRINNSTMVLEEVIDPDQITSVSRDALFAEVECLIMDEIWKQVERHGISWAEILDYRERYTGTPDQVKKSMLYHLRYKNHQARGSCTQNYEQKLQYPPDYRQHPLPYNMPGYVGHNNILPHAVYPTYYSTPCPVMKPPDPYFSNDYNHHYNMYSQHSNHNMCHPPPIPPYSQYPDQYPRSIVPTAQLIELETPVHSHLHSYSTLNDRVSNSQFLSSKAKDDGAGHWENWVATYKMAQSSSSHFDDHQLSDRMRGINLAQPNTTGRNFDSPRNEGDSAVRARVNRSSFELEDAVPKHRLTKNSSESESDAAKFRKTKRVDDDYAKSTNVENGERKQGRSINHNELKSKNSEAREMHKAPEMNDSRSENQKNLRQPQETQNHTNNLDSAHAVQTTSPLVVTLDVSPQFLKDVSPVVDLPPETWECTTCTFLNTKTLNVCEMCAKSRANKDIKHPPGGGKECPHCTLVNDRKKNFCVACNQSLKDSPTYI